MPKESHAKVKWKIWIYSSKKKNCTYEFRFSRFNHGATKWCFWPACDKTWVQSFWGATMGQIFKILTWRNFGPLRQWSRKFLSRIFYPSWTPHAWKLRISLFDSRATKCCFWPACDQNLGSVILRCDHESNFQNLDLEKLRTFTTMPPKVSL